MQAQSTFLGAALLIATAMALPTPQITTTLSQPIIGWPGAQVSSTAVNLQAGDYVPPYSWGGIVTPAGQYDRECSVYRRYRGECTLDQYNPYNAYNPYNPYNGDDYDRAVATDATVDSSETTIEKRQVVGAQGLGLGGSSFTLDNGNPVASSGVGAYPAGVGAYPGVGYPVPQYNPYGYAIGSQAYLDWLNYWNNLRFRGYTWVPFGNSLGSYSAGAAPVVGAQGLSLGSSSFHLDGSK